jgi:hypothetical protein
MCPSRNTASQKALLNARFQALGDRFKFQAYLYANIYSICLRFEPVPRLELGRDPISLNGHAIAIIERVTMRG